MEWRCPQGRRYEQFNCLLPLTLSSTTASRPLAKSERDTPITAEREVDDNSATPVVSLRLIGSWPHSSPFDHPPQQQTDHMQAVEVEQWMGCDPWDMDWSCEVRGRGLRDGPCIWLNVKCIQCGASTHKARPAIIVVLRGSLAQWTRSCSPTPIVQANSPTEVSGE